MIILQRIVRSLGAAVMLAPPTSASAQVIRQLDDAFGRAAGQATRGRTRADLQPPPAGVEVLRLENGLEVLLLPNPSQPMVGVYTQVKVGSAREDFATSGMSHMLEHLLFNGTDKYTQDELYAAADRVGAYNNAHTTDFYTDFMMVLPAEHLEKGLELQSQMLFHSPGAGRQVPQGAGHRPGRAGHEPRPQRPVLPLDPAPGHVRRQQPGPAHPGHHGHHRRPRPRRGPRLLQGLVRAQQHDPDRGWALRPRPDRGLAGAVLRRGAAAVVARGRPDVGAAHRAHRHRQPPRRRRADGRHGVRRTGLRRPRPGRVPARPAAAHRRRQRHPDPRPRGPAGGRPAVPVHLVAGRPGLRALYPRVRPDADHRSGPALPPGAGRPDQRPRRRPRPTTTWPPWSPASAPPS